MAKRPPNLFRAGVFLILVLLIPAAVSCIGPAGAPSSAGSIPADARLIRDVPFFPQEKFQCGPAAMASVLNYRGIRITPEEIAHDIYSESARGTLNIDMVFFAERKGMRATQYSGNLADLKKNINASNPLIVLVDYGFLNYRKDHFMVIVGYDDDNVIAHSGKHSFMPVPNDEFLKIWKKTKYWTLLVQKNKEE